MRRAFTRVNLLIAGLLMSAGLLAQITVSNATFPQIGDTLRTRVATNTDVDLGSAGGNQFWNFENLQGGAIQQVIFTEPSEGSNAADFPEANLLASGNLFSEIYYKRFNNRIDEIGRGNQNFGFEGLDIPIQYTDVPTFRRAPLSYEDNYQDDAAAQVTVAKDQIPAADSLLGSVAALVDSFRITFETVSSIDLDAWGTISIPSGSYEVLREKVASTRTVKLFFYNPLIGWLEAQSEVLDQLGDFADFFGEQKTLTYNFISNDAKEYIASVTQQEGEIVSITYKSPRSPVSSRPELTYTSAEIKAYPNPSFGEITFEVGAFGDGDYKLSIFNIIGKKIKSEQFNVSGGQGYTTDLSHLRKGTYIYTIHNSRGEKIGTKRFLILKP